MSSPVGVLLGSAVAPERGVELARRAEELGYAELWYSEHYFHSGGLVGATAVLDATETIPVGLGVVSAVVRTPAVLAMEVATLARLHPGRVRVGVGAGEPGRLAEMGLKPASPLREVGRCLEETPALVGGQEVGPVRLAFPAESPVPFYVGATGPKMLRLAGALADGSVLSWVKSPAYVAWAREQAEAGAREARRSGRHRVVSLALFSVDRAAERARTVVRPRLVRDLARGRSVFTDLHGTSEQLEAILVRGGAAALARELPESWLDDLAVVGDPPACAAAIERQLDAGADAVALFPVPVERAEEQLELAAAEVLPLVRKGA
ncbi:MAG: LLM class flavin-dependent oxidoreductase [Gaiellaceae bacterium]